MPASFRFLLTLPILAVLATSLGAEENQPRVLILGDSISIGYTPEVARLLADEAVVRRPMKGKGAENCQGTTYGVAQIDRWLAADGGEWDVIHFNFGLHDMKRVHPETKQSSLDPNHPRQADVETYARQLGEIVAKLKRTKAKLIFATTTPVPPGGVKPHRDVADPVRYNAAAKKLLAGEGVAVNDLYSFALARQKKIQRPVNVHFTAEGSKLLGQEVANAIRAALKSTTTESAAP